MPSSKKEQVTQQLFYFLLCDFTPIFDIYIFFLNASGYGGGFNERENVEYIEREESDGEYDEVSTVLHLVIKRVWEMRGFSLVYKLCKG